MRYFVYDLIDPRTGKTFYVGKGQRNRPHEHVSQANRGVQSHKCSVIRKILALGLLPKVRIVYRTRLEKLAYRKEIERIAAFGLHNLTNVVPGGPGGPGASHRPYQCFGMDLPLFDAVKPSPKAIPIPASPWSLKAFNRGAHGLARHVLLAANGHAVIVGDHNITKYVLGSLSQFIENLGIGVVHQRLVQENLYFLRNDVVQIAPDVMAKIKRHIKIHGISPSSKTTAISAT